MSKEIRKVLEDLGEEMPGFVAAAVVLVEDGLSIAEHAASSNVVAGEAAAYLASIVKSNRKAIRLLGGGQVADDILITTDKNYFLIRHGEGKPFFMFIMTTHNEWLGKARMLIRKYESIINGLMVDLA